MMPEPGDSSFYIRMDVDGSFYRVRASEEYAALIRRFGGDTPTWHLVKAPDLLMWSARSETATLSAETFNVAASVLANLADLSSASPRLPSTHDIHGSVLFTGAVEIDHSADEPKGFVQSLSLENEARVGVYCKLAIDEIKKLRLSKTKVSIMSP